VQTNPGPFGLQVTLTVKLAEGGNGQYAAGQAVMRERDVILVRTIDATAAPLDDELRQRCQREGAVERLRAAKRHLRQDLLAMREGGPPASDARGGSGSAHAAGVEQARLMADALGALLRGSSLRPCPLADLPGSSATAEAGNSRLAVARQVATGDSGLLVDSLARADSEAAPREPCTAPSSGEADDTEVETERQAAAERMRALQAARAKLQPTGLAVTSQGLWTVAKKPTLGHTSLGSVKSVSDADSSPLPAPSFACANIEEEGCGSPSSSSTLPM